MRGFFLTMSSFVILLYISIISSIQTSALTEVGRTYADISETSTFSVIVSTFSEDRVKEYLKTITYYALFKMAEHAKDYPLQPSGEDGIENVKDVVLSLIREGRADEFARPLVYNEEEKKYATIKGMKYIYNEMLNNTPYKLSSLDVDIKDFGFYDYKTVYLNTTLTVFVNGSKGGINYSVSSVILVPLQGLPDPMVNREIRNGVKELWFSKGYSGFLEGEVPKPLVMPYTVDAAQGWFYGYVVYADNASQIESSERWKYALVGTLDEILSVEGYDEFGGYVVLGGIRFNRDSNGCISENNTFNPVVRRFNGNECDEFIGNPKTSKPYVVLKERSLSNLPKEGYFSREVIFFNSDVRTGVANAFDKQQGGVVLNVEPVRDGVNCQYYFSSNLSNLPAPNFFQRMLPEPWKYRDEKFGIFSFLVGNFDSKYPAIDFLYFLYKREGCLENNYYIAGLAGAKSPSMIGNSLVNSFSLPYSVASDIGWRDLVSYEKACSRVGGVDASPE